MPILVVHNRYRIRAGEDECTDMEMALLRERGHKVIEYIEDNQHIDRLPAFQLAARTIWSQASYRRIRRLIREQRPSIAHFQNIFPLISPAAYYAAKAAGVATVQTLHNYRLLCPSAILFRDGGPCEDCLGRLIPWPGVIHACYRGSRAASTIVAAMLTVHRALRTWHRQVDLYIALTEFARQKFIEAGLPAERLVVKPNFVHPDPGYSAAPRENAMFVGRLSPEKGLDTLLSSWRQGGAGIPLTIIGEGPLAGMVADMAAQLPAIKVLGRQPLQAVYALLGLAHFLVFPSKWYEGLPRTIIEAFAKGTPVIAPNLGAMSTLVEDGRTGLLFTAGAPDDLAAKVAWAWAHPRAMTEMGRQARHEYEAKYTAEQGYERLMSIYEMARGRSSMDPAPSPSA